MSLFELYISEQPFYYLICEYLNNDNILDILLLNKNIYLNNTNKQYTTKIIKFRMHIASIIISKFMNRYVYYSKYVKYYLNNNLLATKKMNAVYYFQTYEKNYINAWFTINCLWKQNIIDKYKNDNLTKYNRIDMYNIIKRISHDDLFSIGW